MVSIVITPFSRMQMMRCHHQNTLEEYIEVLTERLLMMRTIDA